VERQKIGSRYLGNGLVIAEWSSRGARYSTPNDYVIKRLIVVAVEAGKVSSKEDDVELVASIEVDVISLENGLNGDASMEADADIDDGYLECPVEVYRIPFPYDTNLRKQIIRLIRSQPKMWAY
jgi:hypothetical protein